MTSKLKTHFKHFVIGSLIAALGAGTYVIAAVTFSDFTSGTTISSTEMNTKLNALKVASNKITAFRHVSTVGNSSGACTMIDNPATNGDANAILTVTHEWTGSYYNKVLFAFYDGANYWICNEDTTLPPAARTFNVMVIKP